MRRLGVLGDREEMPSSQNDDDIVLRTMDDVLGRLDRVRPTTRGWSACCPAHDDRTPSLSIAEGDTCVLVKCWAGCELNDIADAMGFHVSDLFYRPAQGHKARVRRSATKRPKWRKQAAALEDSRYGFMPTPYSRSRATSIRRPGRMRIGM